MHPSDQAEVIRKAKAGEIYLLYLSPERITDPACLAFLTGCRGMTLIIDEAHCISTWGHDFRPAYRKLGDLRKLFPRTAIHAFTATATSQVVTEIIAQLDLRDPVVLIGDFDRPNLHLSVERRDHLDRQLLDWVRARPGKSGIVYCSTRAETEQLAEMMRLTGVNVRTYHAGMDGDQRAEAQAWFCDGELDPSTQKVIVATIAFGMGIDKPDVRWIVHTAMPSSMEVWHQEVGRASRDGEPAECVVFYRPDDYGMWESRISGDESIAPEHASTRFADLMSMDDFCGLGECRHFAIKRHFGQTGGSDPNHNCGACDVCDSHPKQRRARKEAGNQYRDRKGAANTEPTQ